MNLREKRAKAKAAALAVEVCFQGGCPFLFGAWREEVEGLAGLLSKPDLIFCKYLLRGLFPQGGGGGPGLGKLLLYISFESQPCLVLPQQLGL